MPKQKLSEKEIQKWILDYLLANRIGFFWRNNTVGVYDPTRKCYRKNKSQVNGIPDILGILYGQFVAIECKKQGRKVLDENQKIFKDKFELNEGHYYLANDIDDFVSWIRELEYILKNEI